MKRMLVSLLALMLITGCSSANVSSPMGGTSAARAAPEPDQATAEAAYRDIGGDEHYEYEFAMENPGTAGGAANDIGGGIDARAISVDSQKIVYTAHLRMQTTDFDEAVPSIERAVASFGGFVQDSKVDGHNIAYQREYYRRGAQFTACIPADQLDAFTDGMSQEFNLVSQSKSASNISSEYYDTQARLESLRIQRERLLEMLGQSGELEHLLAVEQHLAEVNYRIESLTSSMRRMNNDVRYSTVHLRLEEVVAYDMAVQRPATFGIRATTAVEQGWQGFARSIENFMLFILYTMPMWIVLGLIAVAVVLFIRRKKRKKHKAAATQAQQIPENKE